MPSSSTSPTVTRSVRQKNHLRGGSPVSVAVSASLALMGDALLYAVLPTQATSLGIPLVLVGVLLSANRFVRLITNSWAARIYQRYGRGRPFFFAMLVASFTTLAYGLPGGMWLFLPARIMWGTSWSFLYLGMHLSVLEAKREGERGRWMGTTKSISRIGTIAAVSIGGYMVDRVGFRPVMWVLGALTLGGAFLAWRHAPGPPKLRTVGDVPSATLDSNTAPAGDTQTRPTDRTSRVRPTLLYGMGAVNGFVSSGVIMGTLALLLLQRFDGAVGLFGMTVGISTLSGMLLAMRWVIQIALAPASGALGDRFGPERIVPIAATVQAVLLVLLALTQDAYWLLVICAFLFTADVTFSVCLDAAAGGAALRQQQVATVMSHYVTFQDLGAAIGPLVGYLVGLGVGLHGLYIGACLITLFMATRFSLSYRAARRST